jgi:hypothetical protein
VQKSLTFLNLIKKRKLERQSDARSAGRRDTEIGRRRGIPFYCTSAMVLLSLALVWYAVDERFEAPPRGRGKTSLLSSLVAVASTQSCWRCFLCC